MFTKLSNNLLLIKLLTIQAGVSTLADCAAKQGWMIEMLAERRNIVILLPVDVWKEIATKKSTTRN